MPDKPKGMSEFPEQLRSPIVRGSGVTESERYLARLGDHSFLNLWSYPNPYRDQSVPGQSIGKELCDLLVVCDPHIIVFSEKTIEWPDKPSDLAWSRWFKRAVWAATDQLRGAERWISSFPNRIFLDPKCSVPFPLQFPRSPILHRIVVARGAANAARTHIGGSGSLTVKPAIRGKRHFDLNAFGSVEPFCIGDVDPEGGFVHVFDEASLDIVMSELDTITDFTDYLQKREAFLRSGNLETAAGEENLLAYYAIRINEVGEHDFTPPDGQTWDTAGPLVVEAGRYSKFVANPQYHAKKRADRDSYFWDHLITTFTDHMLGGTSVVLEGYTYDLKQNEIGVRYMALEPRFRRRSHGRAALDALEKGRAGDLFFRAMLPDPPSEMADTGFFILTADFKKYMEENGGYDKYRRFRTALGLTYARAILMRTPALKRVVGISMEPPGKGQGSSEDLVYAEQHEWSDEDRRQVQMDCEHYGIMRGVTKPRRINDQEFPETDALTLVFPDEIAFSFSGPTFGNPFPAPRKTNRAERRAARAKARKETKSKK